MGKKQHSKDRLFITRTEWATEWGGAKDRDVRLPFKRLPYYCCALTFTPFSDPMCTKEGHVFELMHIVPYVQKHKKNPVTGTPLSLKDLIKLEFHKNADGEYHCPVLHKVFTEFTHIVAIKTTGNVFSYEAIKELNLKAKNWKELLTDEPFTRNDIITIQDPNQLETKVLSEFDHVQKEIIVESEEMRKMKEDPEYYINMSEDTKRMLRDLGTEKAKQVADEGGGGGKAQTQRAAALAAVKSAKEIPEDTTPAPAMSIVDKASAALHGKTHASAKALSAEKSAARVAAHVAGERVPVNTQLVKSRYSSGAASRSLTSTTYAPVTTNEEEFVKAEKNPKKKGYAKLQTTHGELNIELHCDMAPRTCENFLTLCERGYYDGVIFHRNIRNFMIQGGDPTGTGHGGKSIWGKPFKDEFHSKLQHSGRGILSMANSGPHSNGSQFFILYKSAPHLNRKHTVFGNVVGGIEALSIMDKVPVDDEDRPLEEIKILKASVYVNPYTEPEEPEEQKHKAEETETENDKVGSWYSNPPVSTGGGVAKYLKSSGKLASSLHADSEELPRKKITADSGGVAFKDFSGW
ncbi:ubiquitin-protein ligase, PUB49 [Selaginella moellendorffii]|uniref:Ubiquitin-protein ligase, PUB49 n=1 Tax=Selaginella moellendorffii TaxID=88036 RepID=D8QZK3_SELML|nr:peptidyl-prolyl cis-trans isomerase CYP65 [Selaginella moellendorffii]EFJ34420.1 ubiquitin-protein ligase, PUB49 [Selaginella moellendorffii]|eukprot:XP_002964087.1 peptidyl-prolyl cis-trans isomerase CYP65 [Selaginella moellendorffii]